LGPEGTFAEQALRTIPGTDRADIEPARSVPEALDALRAGEADAALVPLENSIGGQIGGALRELANGGPPGLPPPGPLPGPFSTPRGVRVPVLSPRPAPADRPLATIRTVAAHPQASTQCRNWLREHVPDAEVSDVLSNATAAIGAAAGDYDAAVCAAIAAG